MGKIDFFMNQSIYRGKIPSRVRHEGLKNEVDNMINQILSKRGIGDGSFNLEPDSRRKYIRHNGMRAEIEMADRTYSVRDWSLGGVSFDTQPDARLVEGDRVNVTVRFRFAHETFAISQQIRVVRAAGRVIAGEFAPLSNDDRKQFDRVMDSYNAQSFLESQVA